MSHPDLREQAMGGMPDVVPEGRKKSFTFSGQLSGCMI